MHFRKSFVHRGVFAVLLASLIASFAPAAGGALAAEYAGLVMDAKTGKVLYSHRGDARHYPASLTKMMTLYMLFEAMDAGKVNTKTRIRVSRYAASKPPTKLGVAAGGSVSAEQAILALITRSANDIAAAIGEHLGGTESEFAAMMTRKARQLGMRNTTFQNASGLPNSRQVTTAHDMALLGVALREHFPQYYHYFATRSFTYGKHRIANHNRLLGQVAGVDGIKTGYIRASGYNLVSSVEDNGRSIVAVVLGGRTGKSRNAQMIKLIKTYLPKASKGEDLMVVARPGGVSQGAVAVAALTLPEIGPLPVWRHRPERERPVDETSQRVATAHSAGAPDPAVTFDIAALERKLRDLGIGRVPAPIASPVKAETRTAAAPEPITTAAIRADAFPGHLSGYLAEPAEEEEMQRRSGWQVQIAAVDSPRKAVEMLEAVKRKAPDLLASAEFYTESVEKNGITLYRARFAGFAGKDDARSTCDQLKRKKVSCLAILN